MVVDRERRQMMDYDIDSLTGVTFSTRFDFPRTRSTFDLRVPG